MKYRLAILMSAAAAGLLLTAVPAYRQLARFSRGGDAARRSGAEELSRKTADRSATGIQRKDVSAEARAWQERLLEKHPGLAVEFRTVADEDNGYLQWLAFIDECRATGRWPAASESVRNALLLPEDIAAMIEEEGEWDPTRFGEWMKEDRALIERIIELGLLPERSAGGIEVERVAGQMTLPSNLAAILLSLARHDLEAGNSAGALRTLESMLGSACHADGIESPTYLHMVEAAGLRAKLLEFASSERIAAADPETLGQLRGFIAGARGEPADFAKFPRGEWHVYSATMMLPMLLKNEGSPDLPASLRQHPELVAETFAATSEASTGRFLTATLREMLSSKTAPEIQVPEGVSEETRRDLNQLCHGLTQGLPYSWAGQQVQIAMGEAALAVALGEESPVEPLSGKPYVIDEADGTLKLPDDPLFADLVRPSIRIPRARGK